MKRFFVAITVFILLGASCFGQKYGLGYYNSRWEHTSAKDSIAVIDMLPIPVFKRRADMRRYAKLIYNLKVVYPIAKAANQKLQYAEAQMASIDSKRKRNEFIKQMEKELKAEYTPVLKKMTFSQGKILIKLIDRETTRTSYELVKELRGSFSAFFWQGIARIFGANLKDEYDKMGEDKVIEQLIMLYEADLL